MTPDMAKAALQFIERTTLQPAEINTFTAVHQSLMAIAEGKAVVSEKAELRSLGDLAALEEEGKVPRRADPQEQQQATKNAKSEGAAA